MCPPYLFLVCVGEKETDTGSRRQREAARRSEGSEGGTLRTRESEREALKCEPLIKFDI